MQAAPEDLALTIHPHPTLSEGVLEAFKHSLGEAVHVMNGSAKSRVPSAK
jgi:dihydrolipoamide dehydrogenase